MAKSVYVHLRMVPELKEQLVDAARERFIDLSSLTTLILSEWLRANAKKRRNPLEGAEVEGEGSDADDSSISPPGDKGSRDR